ncbi:MAG: iron-containing alcohol dehydrogenase [Clostridiales Family XIII bacterium]|jgi:alcohol dehydrogenase|nr:iron-containing alcohol dehydrogenase [Clostridiales Family XIII bacterium]
MKDFVFRLPTKVIFGLGKAKEIGEICKEMGARRAFVITGPNIGKSRLLTEIKESIEASGVDCVTYDKTASDPSVELTDEVAAVVRKSKADVLIALGGGSPIDLAKAVAMLQTNDGSVRDYLFGGGKTVTKPAMPLIAIPTTAGTGSEVSAASVITDLQKKIKLSVTHDKIIPQLALVDPLLHTGMPPSITASTGMDALTHAIESYTSLNAEPVSDALGLHAIKLIGQNLRTAVANGQNLEARANMAIAALLAGAAFANGGLGVVHGIAQALGGLHHTAHGIANGVILPYAMQRNCVGNLDKFRDIAVALGENVEGLSLREAACASAHAVYDLLTDIQAPASLPAIGIGRADFPPIIEGTMGFRLLAINPCKLIERDIEGILEAALSGKLQNAY